jgi:hypothetical protein
MAGLSGGFYAVARELTARMVNLGLREGGTYRYTASVVILLHACLEAYINEFLALHRSLHRTEVESKLIELGFSAHSPLEDRWLKIPLMMRGKTFDAGMEPYQSFKLLISLRNTLGHYDAAFRTKAEFPSDKIEALSAKFQFSYVGTADWTSQVLNLECARWACRTAKAMIPKFHELVGGIDYSSQGHPWPDPP